MPAVASTMVPPSFSQPSFSAASSISTAIRSLIDPPGFWDSSLSSRRHLPVSIFVTSTIGVLPIRSSGDFTVALRAGACRDIEDSIRGRRKLKPRIHSVNSRKI